MNILFCDDDERALKILQEEFQNVYGEQGFRIHTTNTPEKIIQLLNTGVPVDILLMDIELEDANGIDAVHQVHQIDPSIQVIYITSYDDYHTRVYKTEHVCFIRKPVKADSLKFAVDIAVQRREEAMSKVLNLVRKSGVERIRLDRIFYIESISRKTVIYVKDAQYELTGKISELTQELDHRFCRCHKSFLVNMAFIDKMTGIAFILTDGREIPISQRFRKSAREEFFKFMGKG